MTSPTEPPAAMPASPSEPAYAVLARKATLLVLLTLVAVIGLSILSRVYWTRSQFLTFLLADSLMNLASGFSCRWVLRRQPAWIKISAAAVMLAAGLAFLGFLTAGRIGIDPWRMGAVAPDWLDIGQLLAGAAILLLCLFAWRRRIVQSGSLPVSAAEAEPANGNGSGSPPRITSSTPEIDPVRNERPAASTPDKARPAKRKRTRLFQRKSRLHLSPAQEHRCPYCLELIEPDDPRGVVECKICHTLHHADCWAITGACQVPHYTS